MHGFITSYYFSGMFNIGLLVSDCCSIREEKKYKATLNGVSFNRSYSPTVR